MKEKGKPPIRILKVKHKGGMQVGEKRIQYWNGQRYVDAPEVVEVVRKADIDLGVAS